MNQQELTPHKLAALRESRSQLAVRHGLPPLGAQMTNQHGIDWLVDGHIYAPDLTSLARDNGHVEADNPRDLLPVVVPQNLSPRLVEFLGEVDRCTCKHLVMLDTMPDCRPLQAHPDGHWIDAWSDPEAILFFLDAAHLHETILAHEVAHIWIDLVQDCEDYRVLCDLSDTAKARQVQYVQSFVLDRKVNEVIRARGFDMAIIDTHQAEAVTLMAQAVEAGYQPPNAREAVFAALTIAATLAEQKPVQPLLSQAISQPTPVEATLATLEHQLSDVYTLAVALAGAVEHHGYSNRASIMACVDECLSLTFAYTEESFDLERDFQEVPPIEVEQDKWPQYFVDWPGKAKAEVGKIMARNNIKAGSMGRYQQTHTGEVTVSFQDDAGIWIEPVAMEHAPCLPPRLPSDLPTSALLRPKTALPRRSVKSQRPSSSGIAPAMPPLSGLTSLSEPKRMNLVHRQGRNYMPGVGRWLSAARLQEQLYSSEHPYTYVHNNPVNRVDPRGNTVLSPKLLNDNHRSVSRSDAEDRRILILLTLLWNSRTCQVTPSIPPVPYLDGAGRIIAGGCRRAWGANHAQGQPLYNMSTAMAFSVCRLLAGKTCEEAPDVCVGLEHNAQNYCATLLTFICGPEL